MHGEVHYMRLLTCVPGDTILASLLLFQCLIVIFMFVYNDCFRKYVFLFLRKIKLVWYTQIIKSMMTGMLMQFLILRKICLFILKPLPSPYQSFFSYICFIFRWNSVYAYHICHRLIYLNISSKSSVVCLSANWVVQKERDLAFRCSLSLSAVSQIYLTFQFSILLHYTMNHCVDRSILKMQFHVAMVLFLFCSSKYNKYNWKWRYKWKSCKILYKKKHHRWHMMDLLGRKDWW
jgi:hypothetical protein